VIGREPAQPEYAVYLVDPGRQRRRLLSLLRALTGSSLETCAHLAHEVPSLVALCWTPEEADGVVARLRAVEAVAAVRPARAPTPAPRPVELPGPRSRRPLLVGLLLLGALQTAVAAWWLSEGRLLAGAAGLLLGLAVILGGFIQIREE